MTTFPLPELSGTYANRVLYNTALLVPGQVWNQIDDGLSGNQTFPKGYYYWSSPLLGWIFDASAIGGGADYDGRGRDTGAGGYVRVNNQDSQSTAIVANPTSSAAYFGLWERLVGGVGATVGMFIAQVIYRTTIRTALGQVLGLWSTNMTTGTNIRMLDLRYSNRHEASLRYGAGGVDANFGQIPCHALVSLTEAGNVGASETIVKTIPIDAGAFSAPGQALDIFAWGICAPNANAKRARIAFGPSTIIGTTSSVTANGNRWRIHAKVYRTGPSAQKFFGDSTFLGAGTMQGSDGTATENENATINITLGLTGAQTDDIFLKGFEIMVYN